MAKVPPDDHCPLAHVIDKREAERLKLAALCEAARESLQFLGAMETVNVLPRRLPQPVQQSFRSRSSSLVYGGRPCCNSTAATWARLRQAAQVATITCQARRSSSLKA
jgi:hypothetical protein